ncbi:MAG: aldehyde dehydrogenase family protein [Candidatus Binatus sp.]|uniref:aldehyde dehydrogenase family protein n=1 Tax=Candidatus Binatus sp. TaxID=2811406 RepID=UPI00271D5BF2|nr:aldehyde dehydrogenase family protein [Candidatus Binatus sp.]MDO8432448.1 aldehyde dehydrogenase family protein [Candidatus Binatus sp.]
MASSKVAGVSVSTDHFIDGKRVESKNKFQVCSPIDGKHLADVSAGSSDEIDAAVAAARRAYPKWASLGPEGRHPILKRFAQSILDHGKEIAAVETEDNGSLLIGNATRMVPRAALNIQFFADRALKLNDETIDSPEVVNHIRFDPAGVAALITPWNGPFMLTTWKVGPCLAAGDTAVVKPPEWAPLTCSLMADLATEAGIAPGVLNIVQGIGEEAGAALAAHPDIDRLSFTGSTDTAKLIGASTAHSLTPTSFELGGKSPFIICADADLDAAAQTAAGQYFNAGQVCLAGTRLLVDAKVADEFQSKLRAAVSQMVVGDPREKTTRVGPLITPEHYKRVEGFVERAFKEGVKPIWGGHRHSAGELYFEPTLLGGVSQQQEIVQREVFGPVLTWQTFRDEDEVMKLANGTDYGLAAVIFSKNEERAMRLARQVVAGTVWVNCFFVRELAAPFGGSRNSGIGREGGNWSFDFYCDIKNIAAMKGSFA